MATEYDVKIQSYDAEGEKTGTKTFKTIAVSTSAAALAKSYAALTNASNSTGKLITTTDLDLDS